MIASLSRASSPETPPTRASYPCSCTLRAAKILGDSPQPSRDDRVTVMQESERGRLVLLVRLRVLSRTEVDRGHADGRETRDVRPRLLRFDRAHSSGDEGAHKRMLGARTSGRRQVRELYFGPAADEGDQIALRLLERDIRREAAVDVEHEEIGHDVAAAPPVSCL